MITQQEYLDLKKDINAKIEKFDERIKLLKEKVQEYENGITQANSFISNFSMRGNVDKLTRPMLTQLVEEILIHEGGNITIRLKCKDAFEQVLEYIEMNKEIIKTA